MHQQRLPAIGCDYPGRTGQVPIEPAALAGVSMAGNQRHKLSAERAFGRPGNRKIRQRFQ